MRPLRVPIVTEHLRLVQHDQVAAVPAAAHGRNRVIEISGHTTLALADGRQGKLKVVPRDPQASEVCRGRPVDGLPHLLRGGGPAQRGSAEVCDEGGEVGVGIVARFDLDAAAQPALVFSLLLKPNTGQLGKKR
jgi:hypothetical protein